MAKRIIQAVATPVSVDVEAGYGNDAGAIADNIVTVAKLGAVGINLEEMGRGDTPALRSVEVASEIIRTAKKRLAAAGLDLFINARVDTYLSKQFSAGEVVGESIRRGRAYVEAGAECVFVPGATDHGEIRQLCEGIRAPVNILALPGVTNGDALRRLGVARSASARPPTTTRSARCTRARWHFSRKGTLSDTSIRPPQAGVG